MSEEELDAWIDALAPVLRLEVTPEYRAGVRQNLAVALNMAELLERAELADDAEPAPVFRA